LEFIELLLWKISLGLFLFKPAVSNSRPTGRMWSSRRFCAAQFGFSLQ